ncbi:15711_t:CDS:2 [Funneliformis caledonium]|uniref:15711_t:CDS:1 n=1 Tax=Funneliformis caledonium TaxID=1117310 RepID=A0A9N9IJS0_9GLOM|nr:15711_t:CDS:2 [Funneliformis caledonium]
MIQRSKSILPWESKGGTFRQGNRPVSFLRGLLESPLYVNSLYAPSSIAPSKDPWQEPRVVPAIPYSGAAELPFP